MPTRQGAIRLFRFSGIDVFLHWSWFLVAVYEINARHRSYSSPVWNVLEYIGLFLIVMLHEFGHALACRQVGGVANQIVLWPLGGVAYVNPPPRPGATLWSIAAGPLVNVALIPVLFGIYMSTAFTGWAATMPNVRTLIMALLVTNTVLLVLNMLPVYPLDGGQMLRSLLWFILGRARSLMVTTVIGFLGIAAFIGFAVWTRDYWLGILAVFLLMNCWNGLRHSQHLLRSEKLPRRPEFACPSCKASPRVGTHWKCAICKQRYDTFQGDAICPHCATRDTDIQCADCGAIGSIHDWVALDVAPARL